MTWTPFILLGVGLLLVFLEFFLPGGVVGAAGGVLLILSIVFFAIESDSPLLVVLYAIVVLGGLGALIKYSLWRLKKGKAKGFFLDTAQEGYVASSFEKELVGKQGEAISDLKPAGHILVEGKRYQALSKMGYLVKGTKIEIVGGQGAHLIVKKVE